MESDKPKNSSPGDMLKAALWYANRGASILPFHTAPDGGCSCRKGADCESSGRHPRTEHGYKDPTTDHAQIAKWWRKWPDANVGMATGKVSGVTVVDADSLEAVRLVQGHCPEGTLTQTTPSGGKQFCFRHEEGLGDWIGVLPGLDIRNDGSQVVLPPSPGRSWHEADASPKPINKMPESLREEILRAKNEREAFVSSTAGKLFEVLAVEDLDLTEDLDQRLEDAKARFEVGETIPEGIRHSTLLPIGASMRGLGVREEKIILAVRWVNANLCAPPLDDHELMKVIESILKLKDDINKRAVQGRVGRNTAACKAVQPLCKHFSTSALQHFSKKADRLTC
jgi:putative DNA primase/helicase